MSIGGDKILNPLSRLRPNTPTFPQTSHELPIIDREAAKGGFLDAAHHKVRIDRLQQGFGAHDQ